VRHLFAVVTLLMAVRPAAAAGGDCLRMLDRLEVHYQRVKRPGIAIGVRITDRTLGGVAYRSYRKGEPLIMDCSLAYSLARAGSYLTSLGVKEAVYSSGYQRRNIRGTSRPSKHSYGLAIDVHTLIGERFGELRVRDDYEQGLGEERDCLGQPLTVPGSLLRTIDCHLSESGLFRHLLTPDFDADHYNHFHLEAAPWGERSPG
jgi:hypothetical protein